MLANIRTVMVNTTHLGNIGAAARAMKTMGLQELVLVEPRLFPHVDANTMASGADDILDNARVVATLADAIADCQLVIALSARDRRLAWPMLTPREAASQVVAEANQAKVAILYGREKYGLRNEELQTSHVHVQIPSDADYGVLNVAAAVQVMCYECRCAALQPTASPMPIPDGGYPSSEKMDLFYEHLQQTLIDVNFYDPDNPRKVLAHMRRLFQRARPCPIELGILRGFLALTQQRCAEARDRHDD